MPECVCSQLPPKQLVRRHRRVRRRGFSFAEVLFAVVVLGIGFIMVAAIFPVAIQQSKATQDETAAAAAARAAVAELQQLSYDSRTSPPLPKWPIILGPTGVTPSVVTGIDTADGWNQLRGTLIFKDDPRYAFVPLYRRYGTPAALPGADWSGTAQIYVIAVQCKGANRPALGTIPARTEPVFDVYDIAGATAGAQFAFTNASNLSPHQVQIKMTDNYKGGGTDIIEVNKQLKNTAGATENHPDAVADGAYIVMCDTGKIFRFGARREDLDADDSGYEFYELQPGNDIQDGVSIGADKPGLIVGRERLSDGSFVGGAQDVSIFTTTIPVKP